MPASFPVDFRVLSAPLGDSGWGIITCGLRSGGIAALSQASPSAQASRAVVSSESFAHSRDQYGATPVWDNYGRLEASTRSRARLSRLAGGQERSSTARGPGS
jgi:hypothetical protein